MKTEGRSMAFLWFRVRPVRTAEKSRSRHFERSEKSVARMPDACSHPDHGLQRRPAADYPHPGAASGRLPRLHPDGSDPPGIHRDSPFRLTLLIVHHLASPVLFTQIRCSEACFTRPPAQASARRTFWRGNATAAPPPACAAWSAEGRLEGEGRRGASRRRRAGARGERSCPRPSAPSWGSGSEQALPL